MHNGPIFAFFLGPFSSGGQKWALTGVIHRNMFFCKCVHESTITCMFPCITQVSAPSMEKGPWCHFDKRSFGDDDKARKEISGESVLRSHSSEVDTQSHNDHCRVNQGQVDVRVNMIKYPPRPPAVGGVVGLWQPTASNPPLGMWRQGNRQRYQRWLIVMDIGEGICGCRGLLPGLMAEL